MVHQGKHDSRKFLLNAHPDDMFLCALSKQAINTTDGFADSMCEAGCLCYNVFSIDDCGITLPYVLV